MTHGCGHQPHTKLDTNQWDVMRHVPLFTTPPKLLPAMKAIGKARLLSFGGQQECCPYNGLRDFRRDAILRVRHPTEAIAC